MGATRKLALVVVIGLIAVTTAMTVYTANEPNRRGDETSMQEDVSIERATSLYITYCLQCHGPAGLGNMELDADGNSMGRVGAPLNQSQMDQKSLEGRSAIFQTEDPVEEGIATDWVRFRIMYGAPSEGQLNRNYNQAPAMPAFRHDMNVEEINSLVWLVMNGDWNYVYNQAVHETGKGACAATPEADRTDVCVGDMPDAIAYPTAPVTDDAVDTAPADTEDAGTSESTDANTADSAAARDHQVVATDNAYDVNEITVKPGDTITLSNEGFAQHDLNVDDLGIATDLLNNGDTMTITIPADAKPGDYEFYCSVPGHKELGMVGTITVEAP